jgi:hypothetical protein
MILKIMRSGHFIFAELHIETKKEVTVKCISNKENLKKAIKY